MFVFTKYNFPILDLPGSSGISPAESIDRSVDSIGGGSVSSSRDDAPPPLPMKTRTASNLSSQDQLSSRNNSSESLNSLRTEESGKMTEPAAASTPEINMFANKLFMDDPVDKTKSLPASARGGLEPLKPPPSEKRSSSILRPPTSGGITKNPPAGAKSVPRPKAGQVRLCLYLLCELCNIF